MEILRKFFDKKQNSHLAVFLAVLLFATVFFAARSVVHDVPDMSAAETAVEAQPVSDNNRAETVRTIADNQNYDLDLKPHKALYDIKLVSTRSGSQIVNISGKMFYEWRPTCEAWISNHRFDLLYEYADSAPMRITSDFSTYETFDGQHLDFTSRRKRDGELFEELRGHAKIKETGVGEAVFTKPAGLMHDLPRGTVFPIQHSRSLLEQIKSGKKFMSVPMFDGSDENGAVQVNSFISGGANPMAEVNGSADLDPALLNTPAWRARLAFFPLKDEGALADYEMDVVFHQNGVISDMVIEYDDFSIVQTLKALEQLESDCAAKDKEGD